MWRLGPRFAVEALFLVLVAVGLAIADVRPLAIVLVMAGAWLIVALIELIASRVPMYAPLPHDVAPVVPAAPEPAVAPAPVEPAARADVAEAGADTEPGVALAEGEPVPVPANGGGEPVQRVELDEQPAHEPLEPPAEHEPAAAGRWRLWSRRTAEESASAAPAPAPADREVDATAEPPAPDSQETPREVGDVPDVHAPSRAWRFWPRRGAPVASGEPVEMAEGAAPVGTAPTEGAAPTAEPGEPPEVAPAAASEADVDDAPPVEPEGAASGAATGGEVER